MCEIGGVRESPLAFFLVAHCSVHNDSMKSGGERRAHCTATRASESREHSRVEEERAAGGSKKRRIYLSFFNSLSLKSQLNFTCPSCRVSQPQLEFPSGFFFFSKEDITAGNHSHHGEAEDRVCAGVCSVVEQLRVAGCLLGEAAMEPGQEAAGWWRRSPAGLIGLGCG